MSETQLRIDLMTVQIDKAKSDMQWEKRKFILQVVSVGMSAAGVVIAAFVAGHFIR